MYGADADADADPAVYMSCALLTLALGTVAFTSANNLNIFNRRACGMRRYIRYLQLSLLNRDGVKRGIKKKQ